MSLTKSQKKYLTGICHHIRPIVMIGNKGLTEPVMQEIDLALTHHELVKVKLRGDRSDRSDWITTITDKTDSELVMSVGQTASFFRQNPEDPQIELPR